MVTKTADRMPTPGHLTRAITQVQEEMNVGEGPRLTYREGEDARGIPCVFWSDQPDVPAYASKDCPEGRVFLAMMEDFKQQRQFRR